MRQDDFAGHSAVAYVRVSTDDKGQTTEHQKREIKQWCKSNNVSLKEMFEDELSGKNKNRPGLLALIGYITLNRVGLVVCYSTSRLAREDDDAPFLKKIVREHGCELHFVDTNVRTGTLEGDLRFGIDTPINAEFRRNLGRQTKVGMASRRGKVHLGRPLACCFAHRVEENRLRIRTEGKQETKIIPMSIVLDASFDGLSISALANVLGVSRWSLDRMFENEGILETYKQVSNDRAKGLPCKRVFSLYPEDQKSVSDEVVQKGTLMQDEIPLLLKNTRSVNEGCKSGRKTGGWA